MFDNAMNAIENMPPVVLASIFVVVIMFFALLVVMTLSALHERDLDRAKQEWEEKHGMELTRW